MSRVAKSPGRTAVSRYLSEINTIPRLTREQESEVGRRAAEGHRASLDELVCSNLGFVVKIASEYHNKGLPLEDLVNEGNIGLIRAASRYDHSKGLKFITYASWWVRKTILQALEEHGSTVRVPAYQRAKAARAAETGDEPRGHFSPALAPMHARMVSFEDFRPNQEHLRLADRLADERCQSAELEMIRAEDLAGLKQQLSFLGEKERAVIAWRFGLVDDRVYTLKEIGDKLGLSRERVRQIEESARRKLRSRPTVWRDSAPGTVANRSPERLRAVTESV